MQCPVCNSDLLSNRLVNSRDTEHFKCPRCGEFELSRTAIADLPYTLTGDSEAMAKLSHAFRRASDSNRNGFFSTATINEILKKPLPRPKEQADLLVRWLAQNSIGPGELVSITASSHAGVIGAKSPSGFAFVVNQLFSTGLLIGHQSQAISAHGDAKAALSFNGWDYYEQLAIGTTNYRKAFMAMQFGDPILESMLDRAFRPAALLAGFELYKLDDVPRAGLIDDRLRVEIQASDFVVADLSHNNLGAYWEAGYAEGLGKPVIYTCEQHKFESTKTHFDTNHHLTIVWDASNPEKAKNELKATIQATLPHLANLNE